MASKAPAKKKAVKKSVEKQSDEIIHWLQDVSLEVPVPASQLNVGKGRREMEFSAAAKEFDLPMPDQVKLELRLRVRIHAEGGTLAMADLCYAGVFPKPSKAEEAQKALAQLYVYAQPCLANLLAMGGHTPPLPESLK